MDQVSLDQRREILMQVVAHEVSRGARLESQMDAMAVLVVGKPTNHILHLLITLFTCGLWVFVWLGMATSQERRVTFMIDAAGRLHVDGRLAAQQPIRPAA